MGMILLGLGALPACRTTETPGSDTKIIGGETYTGQPAIGMLSFKKEMSCTATLISPTRIVTAAHCIDPRFSEPEHYGFHLGPQWEGSQAFAVAKVVRHPAYNDDEAVNDIAYLDLKEVAPIEPIKAHRGSLDGLSGQRLFLVGYGANKGSEDGRPRSGSGTKRAVSMKVVAVNDGKIKLLEEGKSACNGDSGGPALLEVAPGNFELVGVTSCGDIDCFSYGVYTRLDRYLGFLELREQGDKTVSLKTCGTVSSKGVCEGSVLKSCTADCFEAKPLEEDCSQRSSGSCYTYSERGQSICIDSNFRSVSLKVEEIRIVNGNYKREPAAAGTELVFDLPQVNAMTPAHRRLDANGQVEEMLANGAHTVTLKRWLGSHGIAISKALPFTVEAGSSKTVVIAASLEPALIKAQYQTQPGEALFITGQGELLGDWKNAERMQYLNGEWVYQGYLPQGLAFKVVLAKDSGVGTISTQGVGWEQGANHILSRVPGRPANEASIKPSF